VDPGDESEAVGDADAVKSTGYGLRNIQRIVPMLMPATLRPDEDNSELIEIYQRLIDQWSSELEHVVNVVGGSESREKYGGQLGPRFTPLPRARQKAAVQFLNARAFTTPGYFLDTRILRRMEPEGSLRRIGAAQTRILNQLLDSDRLTRLSEYEALAVHDVRRSPDVYAVPELLGDVRRGIWSELGASRVTIDPFRRRLQRSFIAQADAKINPSPAMIISSGRSSGSRSAVSVGSNTDLRALMRGELNDLDSELRAALPRASDRETRLHILDARAEIKRILDPEK
jgi:hypothetical protein